MASLLNSQENRYRGCWVDVNLPDNLAVFKADLVHSLTVWKSNGIKVVWLSINAKRASLIPIATALGFDFHHTRDGVLVLTKTLIEHTVFPEFANHTLGVGGIVFNDRDEVLAVVEKHDMQVNPGHWKFPGGAVDNGELIRDAAVREVREETGIESHFISMVGLRHYHRGQFGTSNIYVICRLQAQNDHITLCPTEIGKAKWFNIDEYLATETVIDFNKTLLRAALTAKGMSDVNLGELHGTPVDEYEIFTYPTDF